MAAEREPEEWVASARTIEEARQFVLAVGICRIMGGRRGEPTLWDAVDAPDKLPGEAGWGEKMGKVWDWKNALPARYPDEIFYGKRRDGAILCSMEKLRELFDAQHRPLEELSETAQHLYRYIAQNPVNNRELKQLAGLAGKANKAVFDRALLELQLAMQIVRVNRDDVDGDTWTPFARQYPGFAR